MMWWKQTKADLVTLRPVGLSFFMIGAATALALGLGAEYLEFILLFAVVFGPVVGPITARWKNTTEARVSREDAALYLEGKMKRYSLLFSVNGGAFAIAKLLDDGNPPGGLSLRGLAAGAALFTVIMTSDIWLWGAGMREQHGPGLFRPVGQTILLMIGALMVSGWVLVGLRGG